LWACRQTGQTEKISVRFGVCVGREGCDMKPLCELRTSRLLEMSADINKQMAEHRILREAIRTAEALGVREPINPAFVALSPPVELRAG